MRIVDLKALHRVLNYADVIDRMRDALIANSRGECDMPMPMHLAIAPEHAEVHIKSSYWRGGKYFALKIASTFPGNVARGMSTGSGMMLLSSAETGEPVALLADHGHLTDVRTAAVAAMVSRELDRHDKVLGILGTGIQARLQAQMHAHVLPLETVWIWGRTPDRVEACRRDLAALGMPDVRVAGSPSEVAREARLIVTTTASREPLLNARELQAGTHISAVGSDSQGKQELDPEILRRASLLLVDSRPQCERLGELQHAPTEWPRAIEIGAFCESRPHWDRAGPTVCDFTGLGVEDLFIADYCFSAIAHAL